MNTGSPRIVPIQRGFTLVEMVATLVIVGILAAVVAPRLMDTNVFQSHGFEEQVKATLRYAQKVAIAQHRFVCATFTSGSVALSTGPTAACGTNLKSISDAGDYVITAPTGITFTAVPTNFSFNALGTPSAAQTININGAASGVTIEAETGYVH